MRHKTHPIEDTTNAARLVAQHIAEDSYAHTHLVAYSIRYEVQHILGQVHETPAAAVEATAETLRNLIYRLQIQAQECDAAAEQLNEEAGTV